jgi:putative glutamine amidotransferase
MTRSPDGSAQPADSPEHRRLRVAISACFFPADPQRPIFKGKTLQYLEQSLAHWVMSTGARAYLVPAPATDGPVTLADLVADFDALVLHGGSDVSPRSYGEEPLRPEWAGDFVRDQYESALLRIFRAERKPVLGICRGMQLMNVALGGTLYQDIGTQVPGAGNHREWEIYDHNSHRISLEPGSHLATLYPGRADWSVNTIHHQAIRTLAPGLRVEARSPNDGIIEAVRGEGPGWTYAVQWHPEFHDARFPDLVPSAPLLADFLSAAAARRP